MKLSIIIPIYNEKDTILEILKKVQAANINGIEKEIIIVDDFSNDGTKEILKTVENPLIKIFYQQANMGKGKAVQIGFNNLSGDIVLIQDADLEYDPNDYINLINPILNGDYEVVYGSRLLKKENRHGHIKYFIGGIFITLITNLLYNSHLTDEPTGYKVFKNNIIKSIQIKSNGFEWEPEITAKILKKGIKIKEVPINYYPRTRSQGKHIRIKDGLLAIWVLIKNRF